MNLAGTGIRDELPLWLTHSKCSRETEGIVCELLLLATFVIIAFIKVSCGN